MTANSVVKIRQDCRMVDSCMIRQYVNNNLYIVFFALSIMALN